MALDGTLFCSLLPPVGRQPMRKPVCFEDKSAAGLARNVRLSTKCCSRDESGGRAGSLFVLGPSCCFEPVSAEDSLNESAGWIY